MHCVKSRKKHAGLSSISAVSTIVQLSCRLPWLLSCHPSVIVIIVVKILNPKFQTYVILNRGSPMLPEQISYRTIGTFNHSHAASSQEHRHDSQERENQISNWSNYLVVWAQHKIKEYNLILFETSSASSILWKPSGAKRRPTATRVGRMSVFSWGFTSLVWERDEGVRWQIVNTSQCNLFQSSKYNN